MLAMVDGDRSGGVKRKKGIFWKQKKRCFWSQKKRKEGI